MHWMCRNRILWLLIVLLGVGCTEEAVNMKTYREIIEKRWDFSCLQEGRKEGEDYFLEDKRYELISIIKNSTITVEKLGCQRSEEYIRITNKKGYQSFLIQTEEHGEYQAIIFPVGSNNPYMVVGEWDTVTTEFKKWIKGLEDINHSQ